MSYAINITKWLLLGKCIINKFYTMESVRLRICKSNMRSPKISDLSSVGLFPFVALMMILIMLVPSSYWNHPINDSEYSGFDKNLIYLNENGGLIRFTPDLLEISALPQSKPTVHLLTTPFDKLKIDFDVRILENEPFTYPLRIDLWSARNGSGTFIEFGNSSNNLLQSGIIIDGVSALSLMDGSEVKRETIGTYDVGRRYNVQINIDKKNGTITTNIFAKDTPPTGSSMLRVDGTELSANQDVISEPIPVEAGKKYKFGGLIKSGYRTGAYKLDIQWLDSEYQHISFYENWQIVEESDGWRNEEFSVTAPEAACYSRVLIGAAEGDQMFFANLFFNQENSRNNLIKNGDFSEGAKAWRKIDSLIIPEILNPFPSISSSVLTATEAPQLFNSLRISLTLSSNSKSDFSKVLVDNYTIILPHQKWQTDKTNDFYLKLIVLALIILGTLLLLKTCILYGLKKILKKSELFLTRTINLMASNISFFKKLLFFLLIYLLLNAILFSLGNLPFDMFIEKIWAYITVKYSPMELYHLPNLVPLAEVWGGIPFHEAVFPYNFGFSYLFTFIGVLYKFFLNGPGDLVIQNYSLEAIIKSVNILFVLLDGFLIYMIMRKRNLDRRQNIITSALFFINPAVIFLSSIWGQTHAISIFFLLAAIWACDNKKSIWTWIFLALGIINRPQMLIPSLLLTIIIFRKFSLRENLRAISVSIIIVFLLLAPFSLILSPSLPFDVLTNVLAVQSGELTS